MKRMLSIIFALLLCFSMFPLPAQAADDTPEATLFDATPPAIPTTGDVWDGSIEAPTKLVKKDGVNYYEITKCSQLAYIAQAGGDWLARNYLLANDLILNDVVLEWDDKGNLTTDTSKLKQWTPIGSRNNPFTGKFDGSGHTVSGLYVNKSSDYVGLFGYSEGAITAVTVVNAHVKGYSYVGGVCGNGSNASSTVTDCVFSGVVNGTSCVGGVCGHIPYRFSISGCANYGTVIGSGGCVGGICGDSSGTVTGCTNYGAVTGLGERVGGVCGGGDAYDCVNYGEVTGTSNVGGVCGIGDASNCCNTAMVAGGSNVGGVCGDASSAYGCANRGAVTGNTNVGGVCGYSHVYSVTGCVNYGVVTGSGGCVGGICGYSNLSSVYYVRRCANYGAVTGTSNVGGVCGLSFKRDVICCANYGAVTGIINVAGVCGSGSCSNCYNTNKATGEKNVGGVTGSLDNGSVYNCYNRGDVKCTVAENNVGAIVGTDGAVWDKDKITGCHYLRTDKINTNLYGCGGVSEADMEPDGFFANTAAELKKQTTYEGWDFSSTWAISSTRNSGYPYLAMEDELPGGGEGPTELTALTLSDDSLSLRVGDTAYLTVSPSPSNATLPTLTWKSDKKAVATVNSSGRVTAVGAGTATITVTGGGFSATCTVTVSAREANEYRINGITLRSASGAELTAIPDGSFIATVSVTKLADGGNTMILLASYTASGQYQGLLYINVSGVPTGATVEFTMPVDNSAGNIAQLKAFSIASFSNPTPLGAAVSFQ